MHHKYDIKSKIEEKLIEKNPKYYLRSLAGKALDLGLRLLRITAWYI